MCRRVKSEPTLPLYLKSIATADDGRRVALSMRARAHKILAASKLLLALLLVLSSGGCAARVAAGAGAAAAGTAVKAGAAALRVTGRAVGRAARAL